VKKLYSTLESSAHNFIFGRPKKVVHLCYRSCVNWLDCCLKLHRIFWQIRACLTSKATFISGRANGLGRNTTVFSEPPASTSQPRAVSRYPSAAFYVFIKEVHTERLEPICCALLQCQTINHVIK